MWRFMLLTFAMLGWAFYEMSGGSDYAPREGTLQAKAPSESGDTPVSSMATVPTGSTESGHEVARGATAIEASAIKLSLAAARRELPAPDAAPKPWQAASRSLFTDPVLPASAAAPAGPPPEPAPLADMRRVSAAAVNMRNGPGTSYSVLGKLSRGERVQVLNDPGSGWVKLRVETTGRVGWMAASLLEKTDA